MHRVLSLFPGDSHLSVDFSLSIATSRSPGVGFQPSVVPRLRRALRSIAPAVVVAHGGEPLKFLVPAMIGARRPLAYYAIGTVPASVRRQPRKGLWRALVRQADVVAAEGEEVRSECGELLRVPPERLVLAPNGRDPAVFKPAARPDRAAPSHSTVTFVGALAPSKRPERFVELVDRLRRRGLEFEALAAGDGPLRGALEDPAGRAGVRMLGSVQDVPGLLRRSDVMIFPSIPTGEGMPGVLIEAGMSGVPVVATDVPGVRSVIEDRVTGLVVGTDDMDALVDATSRLLEDAGTRASMGARARQRCVERFAIDVVADNWLGFLEPLLAPATTGSAAARVRGADGVLQDGLRS